MALVAQDRDLEVHQVPAFDDNYLYVVWHRSLMKAWAVDPGDHQVLARWRSDRGGGVEWQGAMITHHHSDHVGGLGELLSEAPQARVLVNSIEWAKVPKLQRHDRVDYVHDLEVFEVLGTRVTAMHLPAHTLGLTGYRFIEQGWIFLGDALFAMGCGRLFEGTFEQLEQTLFKLKRLPPETLVFSAHEYTLRNLSFALTVEPGNTRLVQRAETVRTLRSRHEPTVPFTIGEECETNPFFRPRSQDIRDQLGMASASDLEVIQRLREMRNRF